MSHFFTENIICRGLSFFVSVNPKRNSISNARRKYFVVKGCTLISDNSLFWENEYLRSSDKTIGNLQTTVAFVFLSIHRHGRHLLLSSSKLPLKPIFHCGGFAIKLCFETEGNEKKPRHVFNLFLSYNKIDKTLDHILRKCISADLTLPNVLQISENQNVVCRKIEPF